MIRVFFLIITLISSPAGAIDWSVRDGESKLGFLVVQAGAEFEGAFKIFTSNIKFDPVDLAVAKVKITIDIASVDTHDAIRDSNIVSSDWFDTKTHPTAIFETFEIKPDGKGGYIAMANLTMRGVTKQVSMPFTVQIDGAASHAKGELRVKRNDYGIGQGQWVATTMVADDVRIFFDLRSDAK